MQRHVTPQLRLCGRYGSRSRLARVTSELPDPTNLAYVMRYRPLRIDPNASRCIRAGPASHLSYLSKRCLLAVTRGREVNARGD